MWWNSNVSPITFGRLAGSIGAKKFLNGWVNERVLIST